MIIPTIVDSMISRIVAINKYLDKVPHKVVEEDLVTMRFETANLLDRIDRILDRRAVDKLMNEAKQEENASDA